MTSDFPCGMRDLERFFIDCDWQECNRLLDAHIPALKADDRHGQVLARLLAYPLAKEA